MSADSLPAGSPPSAREPDGAAHGSFASDQGGARPRRVAKPRGRGAERRREAGARRGEPGAAPRRWERPRGEVSPTSGAALDGQTPTPTPPGHDGWPANVLVKLLRHPAYAELRRAAPRSISAFVDDEFPATSLRAVQRRLEFLETTVISRCRGVGSHAYRLPSAAYASPQLAVNETLRRLYVDDYRRPLRAVDGREVRHPGRPEEPVMLESCIRGDEGAVLHHVLREKLAAAPAGEPSRGVVVEVGMAHGVSALYLGEALRQHALRTPLGALAPTAHDDEAAAAAAAAAPQQQPSREAHADGGLHVLLDPHQSDGEHKWQTVGVRHMRCAGLPFRLLEEASETAMPALLSGRVPGLPALAGACAMVFIDGAHSFDHTLLDLFFADRLAREGGVVALDDAQMESVYHAIAYCASNYAHWRLLGVVHGNVVLFEKGARAAHDSGSHCAAVFAGRTTLARRGPEPSDIAAAAAAAAAAASAGSGLAAAPASAAAAPTEQKHHLHHHQASLLGGATLLPARAVTAPAPATGGPATPTTPATPAMAAVTPTTPAVPSGDVRRTATHASGRARRGGGAGVGGGPASTPHSQPQQGGAHAYRQPARGHARRRWRRGGEEDGASLDDPASGGNG